MPSYWVGQCAPAGAVQPGHRRRRGSTRTFVEISPHPHADPRHQRHPGAGYPSPQHRDPAARHPRHAHLPHQPQRHPHQPSPRHRRTHPNRIRCYPPPPGTTPATGPPARTPTRVAGTHPLLGIGVTDPTSGTRVWESTIGPDVLWLGDHRIDDACVLPGAVYAELALAAAIEAFGSDSDQPWMIRELCLDQLMHITDATVVATTLTGDESKPRVEIRSRNGTSGWTLHASATLERSVQSAPEPLQFDEAPTTGLDPDDLYRRLRSAGQQHGPAFQGIVGLTVSGSGAARAAVRLPSAAKQGSRRFHLHPVMVDIALQALGATQAATDLAGEGNDGAAVVVPVRLAGIRVYGDVTEGVCAIGTLRATSSADRLVGRVMAHRCRRAGPSRNRRDRHGGATRAGRPERAAQPPVHPGMGTGGSRQAGR